MDGTYNQLKVASCTLTLKRYHPHPNYLPYPSRHISIRERWRDRSLTRPSLTFVLGGVQEEKYTVILVNSGSGRGRNVRKILEEVEESRAMFEVYEGGVVSACLVYNPIKIDYLLQFMHQGFTYIVRLMSQR